MDIRPPASLDDIYRERTAEELECTHQSPLLWTAAAVLILARSSPTDIQKAIEASSAVLSADKNTRPLIVCATTTSTISFVVNHYLSIVRYGRLAMLGGPETQEEFVSTIVALASMLPPLLQEALPCVRDSVATRDLTKSLLVLSRLLSQLVVDHFSYAPSDAADVFSAAFDLFLTTHASLLQVVERDPAVFRHSFLEYKHWQILELDKQFQTYSKISKSLATLDPIVPVDMAFFFVLTQYLFVLSSLDVLHVSQAHSELFVPSTSLVAYFLLVNDLDSILPDSVQNDDKRLLKILRSIPQGLSALLHATALMALDPTGTPAPVAIETPPARMHFATDIAENVLRWLRWMPKDVEANFFAYNALDGSEADDRSYIALLDALANFFLYDLVSDTFRDRRIIDDLLDTAAWHRPLFNRMLLNTSMNKSLFWPGFDGPPTERVGSTFDKILSDPTTLFHYLLKKETSFSSDFLQMLVRDRGDGRQGTPGAIHMNRLYTKNRLILFGPFFHVSTQKNLAAAVKKTNSATNSDSSISSRIVHLCMLPSHFMLCSTSSLLLGPRSPLLFLFRIGNLLRNISQHKNTPIYHALFTPEELADFFPFRVFLEVHVETSELLGTLGEAGGTGGVNRIPPQFKGGIWLLLLKRVRRMLDRYPEALRGLTVQSNLATAVLYMGRFLREAESEATLLLGQGPELTFPAPSRPKAGGRGRGARGTKERLRLALERREREAKESALREIRIADAGPAVLNTLRQCRLLLHRIGRSVRIAVDAAAAVEY